MNEATIKPGDLRRELYRHFSVLEPQPGDAPVYIASCRKCGLIVIQIAKMNVEVNASPLLHGLEHIKTCSGGSHE